MEDCGLSCLTECRTDQAWGRGQTVSGGPLAAQPITGLTEDPVRGHPWSETYSGGGRTPDPDPARLRVDPL